MGRPCGCCRCDTEVPALTPLSNSDRLDVQANYSNSLPTYEELVATNCSVDSVVATAHSDSTGSFVELTITFTTTATNARLILGWFPAAAWSTGVRPNVPGWAWQNSASGWSIRNAYADAATAGIFGVAFPGHSGWIIKTPTPIVHVNGAAETLGLVANVALADCWQHGARDSFFRYPYGDSTDFPNAGETIILAGGGADFPDLAGEAADPGTYKHGAGLDIKSGANPAGTYIVKVHVANLFASRTRSKMGIPFAWLETSDTFNLSFTDGGGAQNITLTHKTSADIGGVPTWTTPHPSSPGTFNVSGHTLASYARHSDTGDYAMTFTGSLDRSFSGGDYRLDVVLMIAVNGAVNQLNAQVDGYKDILTHITGFRLYMNLVGDYYDAISALDWITQGTFNTASYGTVAPNSYDLLYKSDADAITQDIDVAGVWLNRSGWHDIVVSGPGEGAIFQPLTGQTVAPRSDITLRLTLDP